jgi:hypothetical protein
MALRLCNPLKYGGLGGLEELTIRLFKTRSDPSTEADFLQPLKSIKVKGGNFVLYRAALH